MDRFYQKHYRYCPQCAASFPPINADMTAVECPACEFVLYAKPSVAVAVAICKDKQLLLAKRGVEPYLGDWDLPGGFVEIGETPEEACVRELKEESGLEIETESYISAYPDRYAEHPTLIIGYSAKITSGNMKAQDDVAQLKWFSLDNLPENIAFDSIRRILADFLPQTKNLVPTKKQLSC